MINELKEDLKKAMKTKDKAMKETIQMVIAKGQGYAKTELVEISNSHIIRAMKLELSQMKESLESMKHMMDELEVMDYEQKIAYIESKLPVMASVEEIEKVITEAINELEEVSMKQMGKIVTKVKAEFGELVDGKLVSELVKKHITK